MKKILESNNEIKKKTFWNSQIVSKIPKCINVNKCSINNNKDTYNAFIYLTNMLSQQLCYLIQFFSVWSLRAKLQLLY